MFLMIGLMLPFFFFAMYERDGLPLEKVLKNIIRTRFLYPPCAALQNRKLLCAA